MYVCMYLRMCVCTYVNVGIHVRMYIHMCVHVYILMLRLGQLRNAICIYKFLHCNILTVIIVSYLLAIVAG